MREILFRGKRIDNGEWEFGDLSQPPYNIVNQILICYVNAWNYRVDPSTVGQYTGLRDKHGKRIFEGDIVKECGFGDAAKAVRYCEREAQFELKSPDFACGELFPPVEQLEVIGNIHDNPELLEGGQDNGWAE